MSRTDKHRPLWVQLADETNPWWWKQEFHDHRDGVCDLKLLHEKGVDTRLGKRIHRFLCNWNSRECYIYVSYSGWDQGMWPRGRGRPRSQHDRCEPRDGMARAALRKLRHQWKSTLDVEDIDSSEKLPRRRWLIANHWWDWD